ncbi:MAG: PIG-L deacetylase family protein [Candidatus Heimdallarchaeaceae archaeon]
MDHIFLSPHLDDAVASCGGLIAKLVEQGNKVIVATFFTKSPDLSKIPSKFHKLPFMTNVKEKIILL